MIEVAAVIIKDGGKILICQRPEDKSCGLLWEFPGGKREVGENLEECLVRECQEELGIEIGIDGVYGKTIFDYPVERIAFTFFSARIIQGVPKLKEHEALAWVRPQGLRDYHFCPADEEIIKKMVEAH